MLTGKNQIVSIIDSGVNELNSLLREMDNSTVTRSTNFKFNFNLKRRKIISYYYDNKTGDGLETLGGHGTFISGVVSGSPVQSIEPFSSFSGVAPESKIAFVDVATKNGILNIPTNVAIYYLKHQKLGAYIHSNSWGSAISNVPYTKMTSNIDQFLYENQQSLVIFSSGNSGASGSTVSSPSDGKNVLSVGSFTKRNAISDRIIKSKNIERSYFSSYGTHDNRIKPEILANGEYLISSYAGEMENLKNAITQKKTGIVSFACGEMVGTSVAAPVIAALAAKMREAFTTGFLCSSNRFVVVPKSLKFDARCCTSFNPSGRLLKTMLIHSGMPVHDNENNKGPTKEEGYGTIESNEMYMLPLQEGIAPPLVLIVFDTIPLDTNVQPFEINITISDESKSFTSTFCIYDPPSQSFARNRTMRRKTIAPLLLHDLDLVVTTMVGEEEIQTFYGNNVSDGDFDNPCERILLPSLEHCSPSYTTNDKSGRCKVRVRIIRGKSMIHGHFLTNVSLVVTAAATLSKNDEKNVRNGDTKQSSSSSSSSSYSPLKGALDHVNDIKRGVTHQKVIPFDLTLGTSRVFSDSAYKFYPDTTHIATIHLNYTYLHSITLYVESEHTSNPFNMDANTHGINQPRHSFAPSGLDCYQLAVNVEGTSGNQIQVGGFNKFLFTPPSKVKSLLKRNWPSEWLTYSSVSESSGFSPPFFIAHRIFPREIIMFDNMWTINMSSGYTESFKAKVRFKGNLTLHLMQFDKKIVVAGPQMVGGGIVEYQHLLTGRKHKLHLVVEVVIITLIVVVLYLWYSTRMHRRHRSRYQRI